MATTELFQHEYSNPRNNAFMVIEDFIKFAGLNVNGEFLKTYINIYWERPEDDGSKVEISAIYEDELRTLDRTNNILFLNKNLRQLGSIKIKEEVFESYELIDVDDIETESARRSMLEDAQTHLGILSKLKMQTSYGPKLFWRPEPTTLFGSLFTSQAEKNKKIETDKQSEKTCVNFDIARNAFLKIFESCASYILKEKELFEKYVSELEDNYYINLIRHKEMLAAGKRSVVETVEMTSDIGVKTGIEAAKVAADLAKRQMEIQTEGYRAQKEIVDDMAGSMANLQNKGRK